LDIIINDELKGKNISAKKASVKMHRKNLVISNNKATKLNVVRL